VQGQISTVKVAEGRGDAPETLLPTDDVMGLRQKD
jgi:hypothetical protein